MPEGRGRRSPKASVQDVRRGTRVKVKERNTDRAAELGTTERPALRGGTTEVPASEACARNARGGGGVHREGNLRGKKGKKIEGATRMTTGDPRVAVATKGSRLQMAHGVPVRPNDQNIPWGEG